MVEPDIIDVLLLFLQEQGYTCLKGEHHIGNVIYECIQISSSDSRDRVTLLVYGTTLRLLGCWAYMNGGQPSFDLNHPKSIDDLAAVLARERLI